MKMTETTNYIYVLKLTEGRYYVGKSDNVIARFQQHISGTGKGSEWTRKYHPMLLIECYESKSVFDEDNKTKEYMMKYGFDNVRGGSYAKFDLTVDDLNALKKEFAGSLGLCFNCGRAGHYIGECTLALARASQIIEGTVVAKAKSDEPFESSLPLTTPASVSMQICQRCRKKQSYRGNVRCQNDHRW